MKASLATQDLTDEQLARALLKRAGLGLLDAARLVLEIQHCSHSPQAELDLEYCLSIIRRGSREGAQGLPEPTFGHAIGQFLESKRHRRPHTQLELRHYTRRILRQNPAWAQRPVSAFGSDECRRMLEECFLNAHSRRKARVILHGFFAFCHKSGWLASNPAHFMDALAPQERRIPPLTLPETARLLRTCLRPEFRCCAPAVGIMLWAGIRPAEVARLLWEDVKMPEGTIILHPWHTKTGGARCVTILPALAWWLKRAGHGSGALCPMNWRRRWASLHRAAGLSPWVPDVLRHSYASYHAARFQNFEQLQYEMGHRSLHLLRYRYLATGCISPQQAADFWEPAFWEKQLNAAAI